MWSKNGCPVAIFPRFPRFSIDAVADKVSSFSYFSDAAKCVLVSFDDVDDDDAIAVLKETERGEK